MESSIKREDGGFLERENGGGMVLMHLRLSKKWRLVMWPRQAKVALW